MVTAWTTFEGEAPELAAWVAWMIKADRFGHVSYLATVRGDGSPRLHPVMAFFHDDRLLMVTSRRSGRYADLVRDGRFVLHPPLAPTIEDTGDVSVRGRAQRIEDETFRRAAALSAPFVGPPGTEFEVFELGLEEVVAVRAVGPRRERARWAPGRLDQALLPEQ